MNMTISKQRLFKLFSTLHRISRSRNLATLHVIPENPLIDDKLTITLNGLNPNQKVTIATSVLENRTFFASSAYFISDREGNVYVDKQPSLGGTYKGFDRMGLFHSMVQVPGDNKRMRYIKTDVTTPQTVKIFVFKDFVALENCHSSNMEPLMSTEIKRWFLHRNVSRVEIRHDGIRGTLFTPEGAGPFPGVIDMYGVPGNLIEFRAAMLASRGFVTFALPYFNFEDLPKKMDGIDFEYLKNSVKWFSALKKVKKEGVGIIGSSKGGELALMLAIECKQVKSVVNINGGPASSIAPVGPFTDYLSLDTTKYRYEGDSVYLLDAFSLNLRQEQVLKTWESKAKILYIVGEDDQAVNPNFSQILLNYYPLHLRHKLHIKKYPGAGHLIEPCYTPVCRTSFDNFLGATVVWGGNMVDHSKAQEDSWQVLQTFFRSTLSISDS